MGPIAPAAAKALLHHPQGEIALLDIREHGQYGEGHPFLAVPCPFSRLEERVARVVPRTGTPIILVDDGDGLAQRATALLAAMGYADISWIAGGATGWEKAGFTLFKGVNLPSKTLGELIEHEWHVPRLDIESFAQWRDTGRNYHLFDGRPGSEHRKMRVPGSVSAPNGELPHRLEGLDLANDAPVLIHCAGRTRSIIGAAGLKLAGIANPVMALENGTQGWALSGRALEFGAEPCALPGVDVAASAARGKRLLANQAIRRIDLVELKRLAEDRSRTLYVLNVRTAEEFAAGSLSCAIHAPAVQIAQATDEWIGVRRARVVLVDDTGLRAGITAVFLRMIGYEVFVLTDVERFAGDVIDLPCRPILPTTPTLPAMAAHDAVTRMQAGDAQLLDLRPSVAFREAHLKGAQWATRARLDRLALDPASDILLTGPTGAVAPAARDLRSIGATRLWQVEGDAATWRETGVAVVTDGRDPSDAEAIDFLFFVHDRHDGNMEAARRYLAWETGLLAQLDAAERGDYAIGPSPF